MAGLSKKLNIEAVILGHQSKKEEALAVEVAITNLCQALENAQSGEEEAVLVGSMEKLSQVQDVEQPEVHSGL